MIENEYNDFFSNSVIFIANVFAGIEIKEHREEAEKCLSKLEKISKEESSEDLEKIENVKKIYFELVKNYSNENYSKKHSFQVVKELSQCLLSIKI